MSGRNSRNAAVREGDWKLIRPFVTRAVPEGESDAAPLLHDLGDDPSESVDLAAEKPELRDRLLEKLDRWSGDVEHERLRRPPFLPPDKQ